MLGVGRVGVLHPVAAQKAEEGVDIRQRHRLDQGQIHVADGDLVQRRGARNTAFFDFDIAKKRAKIQEILIYRLFRMALDGLVIGQEIPQDGWRLQAVIYHNGKVSLSVS